MLLWKECWYCHSLLERKETCYSHILHRWEFIKCNHRYRDIKVQTVYLRTQEGGIHPLFQITRTANTGLSFLLRWDTGRPFRPLLTKGTTHLWENLSFKSFTAFRINRHQPNHWSNSVLILLHRTQRQAYKPKTLEIENARLQTKRLLFYFYPQDFKYSDACWWIQNKDLNRAEIKTARYSKWH